MEKEENKRLLAATQQEIRDLKAKNKTLSDSANSHNSTTNTKIKKMKEKLDELSVENQHLKVILSICQLQFF